MKLYVASKFENYKAVEEFENKAIEAGHKITYSWAPTARAIIEERASSDKRQCAEQDIDGVRDCHVFVLLLHPGLQGALVELGVALARGKEVWLVGEYDYDVVFFHYHRIFRMTMEEAAQELSNRLPSVA